MADANAAKRDEEEDDPSPEQVLYHYNLNANGLPIEVNIKEMPSEFVPIYEVTVPGVGMATKVLILSLRTELLTMVPIDPSKTENKEYLDELTKKVFSASRILIDKYLPGTSESTKDILSAYVRNMMLGFGDLEAPLADENLEEVAVNGAKEAIWVFHKSAGWCKTNIRMQSEEAIYDEAEMIGRRVGREVNNLSPLMDADLADGSRVNATLFPVSQIGNLITIRKFEKNPWTMPAMIANGTINPYLAALTWMCIQNEVSLLITGGTAAGKTSFLNASSIFFPANRRVVSVEETRELSLPNFFQWVPLVTRRPNPEGKGEVTLYNLIINALRLRPDIVVVGEVRVAKDAETLFEAIHTGHAVYGTLHADNAQDTVVRMTNPPIATPKVLLNALGGIIVTFRYRKAGIRRILEFAEVMKTGDANVLNRWNIRNDTFSQVGDMTRLADTVGLYGGLTRKEMDDDIAEKANVLVWMVKHGVLSTDDAGFVVSNYYKNREKVLDIVKNDLPFSQGIF
ncbi:MAG: Flp pilus assembly complex ATPase component TadA [Candidatus Micrarchaeales archaeon]|nr:Flp pilus assembly complex ATPase component TadA [Candidatus Micrarchaeales archaeon]